MGCKSSKDNFGTSIFKVFEVKSVSENGSSKRNGYLQIIDNNLVYFENHKKIVWPLFSLKKYGCGNGLVTLEFGRRCPAGPGTYAFQSDQSDELFAHIDKAVQSLCSVQNQSSGGGVQQQVSENGKEPQLKQSETNDEYAKLGSESSEEDNDVDSNFKYLSLELCNKNQKHPGLYRNSQLNEKLTYAQIDFQKTQALAKTVNDRAQFYRNKFATYFFN